MSGAAITISLALLVTGCSDAEDPPGTTATGEHATVGVEAPTAPATARESDEPPVQEPIDEAVREPEAADACWPEISDVLDGTDLIQLSESKPVPLDRTRVGGRFRAEQGGSVLTLRVRADEDTLHIERSHREPGERPHSASYTLTTATRQGVATDDCQTFLQQTEEGVLVLEGSSGVDGIPSSYWVHYLRR